MISEEFWFKAEQRITKAKGLLRDVAQLYVFKHRGYTKKRMADDVKIAIHELESIPNPHSPAKRSGG